MTSSPSVVVVSETFPPAWSWGGPTRSIWNLCRGLTMAGARVRVVTTNSDVDRALDVPRHRQEQGIDIVTVPVAAWAGPRVCRYALAPGMAREIRRACADASLGVLQGVWTYPVAVGSRVFMRRGLPYVLCPRGTLERISLSEKSVRKRLYMRLIEARAVRGAAALQFDTREEWHNSREAIGETPAIVQSIGVEFAPRMEPRGAALRQRLGLAADQALLGMSGRLHPRKGFEVLLPALVDVDRRAHLVAFGANEANYRQVIERRAAELGLEQRVHFLGNLEDRALHEAYASVDLVVMPSLGESFGMVVVEALAQGTEVLVSDRVPLGGWLARHGLGCVVGELTAAAWATALTRWLGRDEGFDRVHASHVVREQFDLQRSGRRLLDEFLRAARERRR